MSTINSTVKPSDGWFAIYTGPTANPISIEKNSGTSQAYLAIATATPALTFGHSISAGELKNVVLNDGEKLYVKCVDGLSPSAVNIFTVTD
ncbi:TPA: hypothetical protein ACP41M_001065 [Klebsiella aerogenes]